MFLGIETSTTNCSVALFSDQKLIDTIATNDGYSHSENLAEFVDQILQRNNAVIGDLKAIGVGIGPGSYTGLRIGVSFVKGLAYAHKIPVLGFTSLELLVASYVNKAGSVADLLLPMIDARRMEVYVQSFSETGEALNQVAARVIDSEEIQRMVDGSSKCVAFGTGAQKLKEFQSDTFIINEDVVFPDAEAMFSLFDDRFKPENFLDLAYFEPFYLKEFVAGKPKKVILRPQ